MPKKTERVPQRPGEAAERSCRLCGLTKPIAEFYPRKSVPVSTRTTKRGRKPPAGNIAGRMPECITCANPRHVQRERLKRLRKMTLQQLKAELDRVSPVVAAIKTVFLEKTQGRTA